MEVWKDIRDYEGLYQVSNLGNVRNRQRVIKPSMKNGYLFVVLSNHNHKENCYVHRLVAKTFIPNPERLKFVNHKDENKLNNNFSNLEWCTQEYNNAYGTRKAREVLTKSKAVMQMVGGVCIRLWSSTKEAERAGFRSGCISLCCNGKRSTHQGYEWRWVT